MVNGKVKLVIGEYLKEHNIPKLQLSKQSGFDYKTVLKYCNEQPDNIRKGFLEQACRILDCDISDILVFEKEEESDSVS